MTNPLRQYANNVTSSDGEDGIIEHLFGVLGTQNTWCVELGALNGTHDSNTWNLINNKEWSAVLIEGDKIYFDKAQALYKDTARVHMVNTFVMLDGEQSLDEVLAHTPIPKSFDLLVLDIDGNDYHVWESLSNYKPRVMCIEFNPTIPNDIFFVQARDMSVQQGSSLNAITELGKRKGYQLIATNDSNAFFVLQEEYKKFALPENSLDFIHPTSPFYTRLYQLYDGTLVLDGYKKLMWHNILIDEAKIQVLPKHKRQYHAHLSPNAFWRQCKYWLRRSSLYPWLSRIKKVLHI